MRKVLVTLALVSIAGPAGAVVRIIAERQAEDIVAIKYETTGEKARAFALDVTVDRGVVERVFDYHKGPSTAANPGYGIFPANFRRHITVDPNTGEVAGWDVNEYTPVADPCEPGALGGIGTRGITVELGSLYHPADDSSPNAPPNSGTLFRIKIGKEAGLSVVLSAARGGVVLTDPRLAAVVDLTKALIPPYEPVLFPPCCNKPDYYEWVSVGKPECWGYPRQCHGDADGKAQGSAKTGIYYVGTDDLNILIAAWQVKEPQHGPGIASIPNGICADFDRRNQGSAKAGLMRVGTNDLNILVANWLVKQPPEGRGVPADCGETLKP